QSGAQRALENVPSRRAAPAKTAGNAASPVTSAPASRRAAPARTVVLFVDTLHLSTASLMRSKQQLRQFVDEQLTDEDMAAVVTPTGSLGILQQFMRDRARLKYAIDKITPFQPKSSLFTPYLAAQVLSNDPKALGVALQILSVEENYQAISPEAAQNYAMARAREILGEEENYRRASLLTLKAVGERLAALKGQRMIAYVSDGFTLYDGGGGADTQDLRAATSRASRAGVLIYTFNAKGLSTPVESQASSQIPLNAIDLIDYMNRSENDQKDVLRVIADETGARAFLNRNDLHGMLGDMLEENRMYYSLAYYPEDDKDKKKFRKIKVQVKNHPEYTVRVQAGYQPAEEQTEKTAATPQQALFDAMVAPLPATGIDVTASANFLVRAGDDAQATLQIHIGGDSFEYPAQGENHLLECELAVAVFDRQGKIADSSSEQIKAMFTPAQFESARRNGFRYDKRLSLKPGLYQVRVGVREAGSGLLGTANSWLEVPDLGNKKPAMSGLFIGHGREADALGSDGKQAARLKPTAGQTAFKNGDVVSYRFVVYNVAGADGELKIEVTQGDTTVYSGEWQPLSSRAVGNDSRGVEAGGQFKVTLPPGVYTLRLSVKDSRSKKIIQQTLDFEVSP
ncbi:MAG TPA: VWA domain-containing protein, partial [Pyrinomonadaceae bacterium]|nr:VWA domain-containing protein [Pyrinomonadaceae bacterium]